MTPRKRQKWYPRLPILGVYTAIALQIKKAIWKHIKKNIVGDHRIKFKKTPNARFVRKCSHTMDHEPTLNISQLKDMLAEVHIRT